MLILLGKVKVDLPPGITRMVLPYIDVFQRITCIEPTYNVMILDDYMITCLVYVLADEGLPDE